jgi:hypothetical protein
MSLRALRHLVVPLNAVILMALPPLNPKLREAAANVVFVGTVEKLDSHEVKVEHGTDTLFVGQLKITKVEKALLSGTTDKTAEFHFRRTGKRPSGWAGPQGQNGVPALHETIRIFGRYAQPSGELQLLEPNGWEIVKQ